MGKKFLALTLFWKQEHSLDVHNCLQQLLPEDDFRRDACREQWTCHQESGWTVYLPETFNETLGALYHDRFLGSCLYIMKLVMLLFNVTPQDFSYQTCLPKYINMSIGPGFLQTRVGCWGTMIGLRVTLYGSRCVRTRTLMLQLYR